MGGGHENGRLLSYANVPHSVGRIVSQRMASMVELQTVLGAEDLYNMLEILAVDSHNEVLLRKDN